MILNNRFRSIIAIFKKQRKEILRNKKMLTIFLLFPVTMFILSNLDEGMSSSMFLFMIMGAVMPPMMSIATSIAEEREKGTLRGIIFAGVKAYEYLIGMMMFIGMVSIASLGVMGMILERKLEISVSFDVILVSFFAVVCSMIVGAAVGIGTKNQVSISAVIVPVSLIILFSSILGMSNENVHIFSQYLYSQAFLDMLLENSTTTRGIVIMLLNATIALAAFVFLYMKSKKAE